MYYAILRTRENEVSEFIVDENDMPMKWENEDEAIALMSKHVYWNYIDIIEID